MKTAVLLCFAMACDVSLAKPINTVGFDDFSCGAWMRGVYEPELRDVHLRWIYGFVSGYNFATPDHQIPHQAVPRPDTLTLYVNKHCRETPLGGIFDAAIQLVNELRR